MPIFSIFVASGLLKSIVIMHDRVCILGLLCSMRNACISILVHLKGDLTRNIPTCIKTFQACRSRWKSFPTFKGFLINYPPQNWWSITIWERSRICELLDSCITSWLFCTNRRESKMMKTRKKDRRSRKYNSSFDWWGYRNRTTTCSSLLVRSGVVWAV